MKIWILNHYATDMYFSGGGRHQWFAKYLIRDGHEVRIFCANTLHNSENIIDTGEEQFIEKVGKDNVPYCFIKTAPYKGNGVSRIKNMLSFYRRVKSVCQKKFKCGDTPDVILASSVHPLTLMAGIQIGNKFNIPCICEVRDMWPFTLVEFGRLKEASIITKLLYKGEKWLYKKADRLIFTMKGGKQYILDKGWEEDINLDKIYYINNGIDLEDFNINKNLYEFADSDLDSDKFKVIYTGSMGEANQIDKIIEVAKGIKDIGIGNIIFILYGDGPLRESMERRCYEEEISNVIFKGKVEKNKIPCILSKGDANILTIKDSALYRYGISMNKVFDYLASAKPMVCNNRYIDSIADHEICAIVDKDLVQGILAVYGMDGMEYNNICQNSKQVSRKYDFSVLTNKLIDVIDCCLLEFDRNEK